MSSAGNSQSSINNFPYYLSRYFNPLSALTNLSPMVNDDNLWYSMYDLKKLNLVSTKKIIDSILKYEFVENPTSWKGSNKISKSHLLSQCRTAFIFPDTSAAIVIHDPNKFRYDGHCALITDTWAIGTDNLSNNNNTDYGLLVFDKHGRPVAVIMHPKHGLHIYTNGNWRWNVLSNWDTIFANTNGSLDLNAPPLMNECLAFVTAQRFSQIFSINTNQLQSVIKREGDEEWYCRRNGNYYNLRQLNLVSSKRIVDSIETHESVDFPKTWKESIKIPKNNLKPRHKMAFLFSDSSAAVVIHDPNKFRYDNGSLLTDSWEICTETIGIHDNTDFGLLVFDQNGRPTAVIMYPGHGLHYYINGNWKWSDYWDWEKVFAGAHESLDQNAPQLIITPQTSSIDLSLGI